MIFERGIEANPEKINAIMDMPPPYWIKDVQKLASRLAALNRFISKSADKGLPFFKVFRGSAKFESINSSQETFDGLKRYLILPSLLMKPKMGEVMYIYLAISESGISSVLVRQECKEHHPVYYVSKVLQGAEIRYSQIEKLALSLVVAARKLRSYFQSHPVIVLTNHPLKQVLSNPELLGRMVKWAVELSEFDIKFGLRPTIKAQVLADFIVKSTHDETSISTPTWSLHVDGSYTTIGSGVGIVLESPQAGSELALAVRARKIVINNNSQLVVNQIQGSYEARGEKIAKNLLKAKDILDRFEKSSLIQVLRADNTVADQLARLASSMATIRNRRITILSSDRAAVEQQMEIMCMGPTPPSWKEDIMRFLTQKEPP
ncbi:Retrovirus-related Pol polyprotein from transposon opus [Sesamum angolense]|uniref:Retrovirus-related Pol polyprotein from transposon opus n=1 Tax=Sesamum angolense TaxID=2727404 RepID=A0AAE1WN91_9LAMI|nr:Retrovirus-related Pol polyprotein from transposon opus [Sesamum angolense]